MKRILFVDGSNLFGGLAELLGVGQYINFPDLLGLIEEDFTIDEVRFYGTYMRINPKKSASYTAKVRAQKAFFDSAKKISKLSFFKGHFSGVGKEKGVDVRLAVDLSTSAAINNLDEAIIMTGDADLVYAIETAKKFQKNIHLAVLGSRYPFGAVPHVSKVFVYDFKQFFRKSILPTYHYKPKDLTLRDLDGRIKINKIKTPAESAGGVS